jgi:5'-3' exonuclease
MSKEIKIIKTISIPNSKLRKLKTYSKKQNVSNVDFDPFEIYPNNMEKNKPILLVDLGYTTFYRFNATKTWYKMSHPEEKEAVSKDDYDWGENPEFMEKFNSQYLAKILEMAKKYKVPSHNIVLAQDCSSCDNWRNGLFKNYKQTRKDQRAKKGFDGAKVFKHAHEYTFKAMAKNNGFKLFKHKEIEADDINAIITKYFQEHFPKVDVYILASDKDYLQLSNGKLHLIDFKGKIINDKEKDAKNADGEYQLWHKIISGDKSDDIAPLKIKRSYLRPNAKPNQYTHINATKKDAELLASNWKKFLKDIEKDDELIDKKQLELSRKLIDFNLIPKKYESVIVKQLDKLL